ncbi:hypothetical protein ADL27_56690 [Streptomyces sp. NRRL F-6602]|nr:hypothetical protein ADL27_56690 [Streptomyces sp. NRRL F-6602]
MPTTDTFGQGIPLPALTDAPDGPKALADLAAGFLPIGVPKYASASERGATITAPRAGQLAWLQDTKLLTLYDGSAWTVVAAGTQSWTTISLASGWTQNGNDNGVLQYRIVNLFGAPTIMLRGAIGRTTYPTPVPGSWIITASPLPAAARPTSKRTILVTCSDASSDRLALKADLQVDGHISVWGTGVNTRPPWVSFNGCFASL